MKINQYAENSKRLNDLIRQQRNKIVLMENEVANIDKLNKKKIKNIKYQNYQQASDLRSKNQTELIAEIEKHKGKIDNIRKEILKQEEKLNQQKLNLLNDFRIKKKEIIGNNTMKAEDIFLSGEEYAKNLNDKVTASNKDLHHKTRAKIEQIENRNRKKIEQAIIEADIKKADHEAKLLLRQREQKQEAIKKGRERRADRLSRLNKKYRQEEMNFINNHQRNMELMKHRHKLEKNQELTTFNERIKSLKEVHKKNIAALKEKMQAEINQLNKDLALTKKNIQDKSTDSFYRIKRLDPVITQGEKFYTVNIKVPEHEQDLVQLSADKRKIKLMQTRRFAAEGESPDGAVYSSKRSEVIRREFNVKDFLDSDSVKQKYENGILSFQISKL